MSYLDRLKKLKTPTVGTVKTAKSPFDSKDSCDGTRFQETDHPFDSKDSIEDRRFQKIDPASALAKFCRKDCPGLETIDLPYEGAVVGCVNPFTRAWRRLDWLKECPSMQKITTRPTLPEWCKPVCEHYHESGGVVWCRQEVDGQHWFRDWRISSLSSCPLSESAPGREPTSKESRR